MEKNKFDENKLRKEISKICKKYNIDDIVFAGTVKSENRFIGFYGRDTSLTKTDFVLACMNSARLYQGAREKIMLLMDAKI